MAGCGGGQGADVIFIADTSADIGLANFQFMKDFIKDVVRDPRMAISSFGVILFDDMTREVITLAQNDNLLQRIDNIVYVPKLPRTPRKTHAGLVALQGAFNFASVVFNRIKPKYGILLTNGISDNTAETIRQAQSAAFLGIQIIVIGRLNPNQPNLPRELESVASAPREVFLSPIINWSDVRTLGIAGLTVNVICSSSGIRNFPKICSTRVNRAD